MDFSTPHLILALTPILLFYIYHKIYNYWKSRNIPQLNPTPFFGNIASYILNRENYHTTIKRLYNSAPPNQPYIGIYEMLIPSLLICDPKLANDILVKNFHSFSTRGTNWLLIPNKSLNPLSDNIVSYDGARWKYNRQKQSPIFTTAKYRKVLFELAYNAIDDMKTVLNDSPEEIEITDISIKYLITIMGPWILGVDANSFKSENCDILKACQDTININISIRHFLFGIHPKLREWLGVPDFSPNGTRTLIALIRATLEYRKTNNLHRDDYLDVVANIVDNFSDIGEEKLDEYDIFGNVFMTFAASFESTMTLLSFTLYEIAIHDEIQQKAREEIAKICQPADKLEFDSLNEMKYIDMIISEAARKYPADAIVFRKCTEKCQLPSTDSWIEPGTTVYIPIYGFHYDPKYFPDPEKFDPERFSAENQTSIPTGAYIPFGGGPRICIGMRSATLIIKLAIFEILKNYQLSAGDKTQIPLQFLKGRFMLNPENGIWLNIKKLSNSP